MEAADNLGLGEGAYDSLSETLRVAVGRGTVIPRCRVGRGRDMASTYFERRVRDTYMRQEGLCPFIYSTGPTQALGATRSSFPATLFATFHKRRQATADRMCHPISFSDEQFPRERNFINVK